MNQLLLFVISLILLTLFIKLGFYLTRTYIDIQVVLITVLIVNITNVFTSKFGFMGVLINSTFSLYLLSKLGGIEPWPDTVLAIAVGEGLYVITAITLILKFNFT